MHPWKPWIVLAALAAFAAQATVVYKWTDADGVVHYSDQPVPGAEKISTGGTNTATSGSSGRTTDAPATDAEKKMGALDYAEFSITSPTPEQSFFADQPINANLALSPNLKAGQTVTWHLNGADIADQGPAATAITLPRLDRGTYAIAATVTDPETGQSRSSDSVTFYVRQPSELSPQYRKP
jgi:Domain of unknown function (DUF4124)